jgi:DNA modification methylase
MTVLLARADARALPLRDGSVQCCVTSPPYWGLRDYGTPGQLGLEPTPEEYVEHMVEVFREVRRVLRDDGVLWLNLGDSYAANRSYQVPDSKHVDVGNNGGMSVPPGLKPKDLVGVPWRVAFALRADGWWLRSDIIWHKPNPMPESVTDRPTRSHEYLFLLTKAARYYYDAEAVKERSTGQTGAASNFKRTTKDHIIPGQSVTQHREEREPTEDNGSRNLRSVWTVTTQPYKGAHYATFPTKIVEPCILAGTSAKGACATCGTPWERVVEREKAPHVDESSLDRFGTGEAGVHRKVGQAYQNWLDAHPPRTTGWQPTCTCGTESTRPCVVLDPFCGTATVARVAIAHGRRAVCFDISGEYLSKLATKRTHNVQLEMIG